MSRELSLRSPSEPGVKALQPVTAWYPVAGSLCVIMEAHSETLKQGLSLTLESIRA